jgi:release factor glutamine methyltransferase
VSNPPYVDPSELAELEPEVRDHEPRAALVAADGADALYARLAREAAGVLKPRGGLAVEIGAGREASVSRALGHAGFEAIRSLPDLAGIPRVLIGRRSAAKAVLLD